MRVFAEARHLFLNAPSTTASNGLETTALFQQQSESVDGRSPVQPKPKSSVTGKFWFDCLQYKARRLRYPP